MNKLRGEYFFQKSFWVSSPHINISEEEGTDHLALLKNENMEWKYQKIVFIKEIFDIAEHSLSRKGYQQNSDSESISSLIEKHPAYRKFYLTYKLSKYFSAFKDYFAQLNQKQQSVKYEIQGKRVYESALCWYRDHIQTQIIRENLDAKSECLQSLLSEKRKQEFMHEFCKMTEKKSEELHASLVI